MSRKDPRLVKCFLFKGQARGLWATGRATPILPKAALNREPLSHTGTHLFFHSAFCSVETVLSLSLSLFLSHTQALDRKPASPLFFLYFRGTHCPAGVEIKASLINA